MYSLSKRQEKALHERGTQIMIALPCPHPTPASLAVHVRRSLNDLDGIDISAEIQEVAVQLPPMSKSGGLQEVYGIIHPKHSPERPEPIIVIVIIATLTPPDHRHTETRLQWPGSYVSPSGIEFP